MEDKPRSQGLFYFSISVLPLASTESWAHPHMQNKKSLTDILRLWELIKRLWSTLGSWREAKCHLLSTKIQLPVRLANPIIRILLCLLNTANLQWVSKVHVYGSTFSNFREMNFLPNLCCFTSPVTAQPNYVQKETWCDPQ